MKVVHIGTADNDGGAAKAAFRLHVGLLERRVDSKMLVGYKTEDRPEIDELPSRHPLLKKLWIRGTNAIERRLGLQYLIIPWKRRFLTHPFVRQADVVNLHNIHGGFFSHRILPQLSANKPIVWTLHDCWSMTGHCSYPGLYDCDRWKTGCGKCPSLEDYPPISIDTTAFLWRTKKQLYRKSKLTIVAPSLWLCRMAQQSPVFEGFAVHHIPYGMNDELFRPVPKNEARTTLGLPLDKKIIFFTAADIHFARKGLAYLIQALKTMQRQREKLLLMVVGRGTIGNDDLKELPEVRHMPFSDDESKMPLFYSAADVFALPTLADNLPNTILESMACGTPVAGFDIGGVGDLVRTNETGYLAKYKDAGDLANGLTQLLEDDARRQKIGERCQEVIAKDYRRGVQAARYEALYQTLLA